MPQPGIGQPSGTNSFTLSTVPRSATLTKETKSTYIDFTFVPLQLNFIVLNFLLNE